MWGATDPNSQHQLWSEWRFTVGGGRRPPLADVEHNWDRWCRRFGSVCRMKIQRRHHLRTGLVYDVLLAQVEGRPAHDPGYVASVARAFERFCEAGYGPAAWWRHRVRILAGDRQDGSPRAQLLAIPAQPCPTPKA